MRKLTIILAIFIAGCATDDGLGTPRLTQSNGNDPGKAEDECFPAFGSNELNIATWNIEQFSLSNTNIALVQEIIERLDVDLIAVQEILSEVDFLSMLDELDGWIGLVSSQSGLKTGYIVKSAAFERFQEPIELFQEQNDLFPTHPLLLQMIHVSGLNVSFINYYSLRMADTVGTADTADLRFEASRHLKEYMDSTQTLVPIVVLGDFNADLGVQSPYYNFQLDAEHYLFADASLGTENGDDFSIPSLQTDHDHLLITNELFNNLRYAEVILPEACIANYGSQVSKHRPVMATLK